VARPKKTPEEIADDDARTIPMALFNTAEAFWLSAAALEKANVRSGFASKPIYVLYYHAIELYLKAYLRQFYGINHLANQFGHNTEKLANRGVELGLFLTKRDKALARVISQDNGVVRARYPRQGAISLPVFDELESSCRRIRLRVGKKLRRGGVMVRL